MPSTHNPKAKAAAAHKSVRRPGRTYPEPLAVPAAADDATTAAAPAPAPPPTPLKRIAVIGGGPKAVALATKAKVLRDLGIKNVEVTIFEPRRIGAAWAGKDGYTDGELQLCTVAERDVGFPYERADFARAVSSLPNPPKDLGLAVVEGMMGYSWQTYLMTAADSHKSETLTFGSWVDKGRERPKHIDFANYLQWACAKAGNTPEKFWVCGMAEVDGKWQLHVSTKQVDKVGKAYSKCLFDGVVVTGPGPAKALTLVDEEGKPATSDAVFDGANFWTRKRDVLAKLNAMSRKPDDDPIIIVGGGGTAASILAWLLAKGGPKLPIQLFTNQAALPTRVDSVFDNKMFSDETLWASLSSKQQREFFDRVNRGVVWDSVYGRVKSAESLVAQTATANKLVLLADGAVGVKLTFGNGEQRMPSSKFVVDATGFDPWWFLPLIPGYKRREQLDEDEQKARKKECDALVDAMEPDLSLPESLWKKPLLHAPGLSSRVGPGFGSLMVLGRMANRILDSY